ncbi:hypothetical protein DFH09DRAFT_1105629 [Mycena vulgaris]|nr:hypothetical protein DFH09DRAFT_1105629 [Mycena vulgaris]
MFFSAGTEETGATSRGELLEGIRNLDYYDHTMFGKMDREDLTVSSAVELMVEMGLDDSDAGSEAEYSHKDSRWSPHGSKPASRSRSNTNNLPRLRLSDDQLKTIIWVMRECKTPDVPSFSALRRKTSTSKPGITYLMGNKFYMNHPAELLALDWANPLVREFMQLNQADKWTKEIDLDELSPMWLKDGQFVIPMRCVIFNKQEYAKVHKVIHYPASDCFVIHDEETVRVLATDLQYNYLDLRETGYSFKFPESLPLWAQCMPNPVRNIAKGRPVFSVRIIPWSDDVSGNVSQEYFIKFCSTSPHASSGEQLEALAEDLDPDKHHEAYACKLEQEILFRIFAHVLPADNPQQAESASNAGVNANLWCRYDMAGGTSAYRESDEGYRALFKPGIPRTPAQTIRIIKRQIWAACTGVQDAVDDLQTSTGVKDKTALVWIAKLIVKARETQKERFKTDPRLRDKNLKGDARKAVKTRIKDLIQWELYNWVILQPTHHSSKLPKNSERQQLRPGDHYNILLRVRGLDPHRDSPFEILHSILLGDDKYIWHETNTPWDQAKGEKFAVRLQSSSRNGLNFPSVRGQYIVKYKNRLIGKHFKILQQLGAFHLHDDLSGKNLSNLWKASGELGALLWFPEIRNMEQYLIDRQICIDNVLDLWALIDPARIMTKYKLHAISHLPDDIRRFGPAILYATEGFEAWNAISRLCSVLSSHQAPSHDIGVTLADMERFKHQVSGGWWKPQGSQEYIQAGGEVISFLDKNKELQGRLGWMDKSKPKPGSIKLDARLTAVSQPWRQILGSLWSPGLDTGAGKLWTTCKYVVSQSGDMCTKDSWVFSSARDTLPRALTAPTPFFLDHDTKHNELAALLRVSGPEKRAAALKKSRATREKRNRLKQPQSRRN